MIGKKNMLRFQEVNHFRRISLSSAEVYGDYEGLMSEDVMDKVPIIEDKFFRVLEIACRTAEPRGLA